MQVAAEKIRRFLFYLLIFIIPWQTRWIIRDPLINDEVWEYGRLSLYSWDIILVILLLVSLPAIVRELRNFKFLILNFKLNFGIFKSSILIYLLLLLFTLTSLFWAGDKVLVLLWVWRLIEGGAVWFLIKTVKPKLKNILLSLSLAGTIQALWGAGQFITQSTFANKWLGVAAHPLNQYGTSVVLTETERWLRAYGGQVHPNVLGGLLVITCLVTVYLIIKNYKFKILNFYWLLLLYIIQVAGLFFTFSRGAWLALFLSLVIWLIISRQENVGSGQNSANADFTLSETKFYHIKRSLVILGYTFLVFITLGVALWQPTKARLLGGNRLETKSVNERVSSIYDGKKIIEQNWWNGAGIGNYTYKLQQLVPEEKADYYQPVHNVFLLIGAELGLVGLLLFFWLWVNVFLRRPLTISHWLLTAVLVTAMFDHYWWTIPSMALLFWLMLFLPSIQSINSAS